MMSSDKNFSVENEAVVDVIDKTNSFMDKHGHSMKDLTEFFTQVSGKDYDYYKVRRILKKEQQAITLQELTWLVQFRQFKQSGQKVADLYRFLVDVEEANIGGKFGELSRMAKSGSINYREVSRYERIIKKLAKDASSLRDSLTPEIEDINAS